MSRLTNVPQGLLGLAPLLGASDLLVKALGLVLVGLPVLVGFALLLSPWARHLPSRAYWLAAASLAATLVGCAELLIQGFAFELHRSLGPFLPLLVLPCLQLAHAEPGQPGAGLRLGLVFALAALGLGALREASGSGTVFAHLDWLLGSQAANWRVELPLDGLPLLALAPGAFILLGLLLAAGHRFFTVKTDLS